MTLTIDEIIRQLFDGLDKDEADWELARTRLTEYYAASQMSLKELNEICWEDSTFAFGIIYGF